MQKAVESGRQAYLAGRMEKNATCFSFFTPKRLDRIEFMPSSLRPELKNAKKSFVLRKGRTTSAQRRALKYLKKQHTIQLGEDKVDFSAAFEGQPKN